MHEFKKSKIMKFKKKQTKKLSLKKQQMVKLNNLKSIKGGDINPGNTITDPASRNCDTSVIK